MCKIVIGELALVHTQASDTSGHSLITKQLEVKSANAQIRILIQMFSSPP